MKEAMGKNLVLAAMAVAVLALRLGAQDIPFNLPGRGFSSLGSVPVSAPAPVESAAPAPAKTAVPEREWLVMVFINGRNNLAPDAVKDVNEMEMVGSTDKVAVTVEMGLFHDRGNSSRFLIQKDTRFPVSDMVVGDTDSVHIISGGIKVPNADMGSWKHFADFAKWSIKRYPAKKVLAVLWNHGSGRVDIGGPDNSGSELGISYDDTTRNFIRNRQVGMALAEIRRVTGRKVDVYAADACLMQMASVVYELKDHTDVVVGSEEIVPNTGLPYNTILQALNSNSETDAEGLGRIIVEKSHDFYSSPAAQSTLLNTDYGTTVSAIRTSQLGGFVQVLNAWVAEAIHPENAAILKSAFSSTFLLEYGKDGPDNGSNARTRDLYDFITLVNSDPAVSPALKTRGQALRNFIVDRLVIANAITGPYPDYVRVKGLAIYFPQMIYDPSYDETRFAADSLWDDFVKLLLAREQQ